MRFIIVLSSAYRHNAEPPLNRQQNQTVSLEVFRILFLSFLLQIAFRITIDIEAIRFAKLTMEEDHLKLTGQRISRPSVGRKELLIVKIGDVHLWNFYFSIAQSLKSPPTIAHGSTNPRTESAELCRVVDLPPLDGGISLVRQLDQSVIVLLIGQQPCRIAIQIDDDSLLEMQTSHRQELRQLILLQLR